MMSTEHYINTAIKSYHGFVSERELYAKALANSDLQQFSERMYDQFSAVSNEKVKRWFPQFENPKGITLIELVALISVGIRARHISDTYAIAKGFVEYICLDEDMERKKELLVMKYENNCILFDFTFAQYFSGIDARLEDKGMLNIYQEHLEPYRDVLYRERILPLWMFPGCTPLSKEEVTFALFYTIQYWYSSQGYCFFEDDIELETIIHSAFFKFPFDELGQRLGQHVETFAADSGLFGKYHN